VHIRPLVSLEDDYDLLVVAVVAVFVDSDEAFPTLWGIGRFGARKERVR